MNCDQFSECIADYLESELPPARSAACAEHLAACPACHQNIVELQQIRGLVLTAGSPPAKSTPARAIKDEKATRLRRRLRLSVVALRYAAVITLAFGSGYVARRPQIETRVERVPATPNIVVPAAPTALPASLATDPKMQLEYQQITAAFPQTSTFGKTLILLAKK